MPPNTPGRPDRAKKITDTTLRNAKAGAKTYRIGVGGALYLEVSSTGSKLWRWKYRLGGKENRLAIGSYPTVSLREAGKARDDARVLVKAGIHPSHQKLSERIQQGLARDNTFSAIAAEWLDTKTWEPITKTRRRRLLESRIFPPIGKLPVTAITPAHILDILKTIAKTAPTVAAEARRTMSGIFEHAIATLRATTDPTYPVRKALAKNKTKHKQPLKADEIGSLLRDIENSPGNFQTKAAFRLGWLTALRPGEVVGAEWAEFDLVHAEWRIPAPRMKMDQLHVVPLPTQAVDLLRAMHGITGNKKFVFPHRDDRERNMTKESVRGVIYKAGWKGRFSPHAVRATASTHLNEMGYDKQWVEAQLAHGDTDPVRASYNFAEYYQGRAKMMQQWADYLDALAAGAKVLPGRFGGLSRSSIS